MEALDLMDYADDPDTWYYSLACILGNLSLQVFPVTPQEKDAWEAEYQLWQAQYEQDVRKRTA